MSDLSQPAPSLLASSGDGFAWPTPELAGYPAPSVSAQPLACDIEGLNGKVLDGQLMLFAPERGVMQMMLNRPRRALSLRLEQFRRMRLVEPLRAESGSRDARAAALRPAVPFRVEFKNAEPWQGLTVGYHDKPWGLFLFQPMDDQGTVQRWFVPRTAIARTELGPRLGETLVGHNSASPEQLREALAEQQEMRQRKLGDMLVVKQIITADELNAAIEQQSRMPMVRIGEALVALGFISQDQLDEALVQQRSDRTVPLGELMVKKGAITRADLQTALARKLGYPLVDVMQFPSDTEALAKVPYAVAQRLQALPLMRRAGRLVVALEDPSNRTKVDELEFAAQCKVVPVLARSGVLPAAVDREYEKMGAATGAAASTDANPVLDFELGDASKLLASMEKGDVPVTEENEEPGIEQSDNSLVRLINSMILEAQSQGVSDIHIECPAGKEKVRIRFRRDGQLRPYLELPPTYRSALIARIKIMCDLDISERRKPQDGKINFSKFVQGVKLELRVATIPTNAGMEDAVLRLLQSSKPIPLDNLGLSPANLTHFKAAIQRPYGMLLCVGPTGSGKTTTLHSAMGFINTPERKIWTAEDPVEITQQGLRQVQVNPRIEWTFAKALRAFLRADPDVIMVGEIRDNETAQVSVEASLTGHLVLSTLHTNSAPETVTRLLDMGMDPFNFADALLGVLAQRLVRRLCAKCRTPHVATEADLDELAGDYLHVLQGVEGAPDAQALRQEWLQRWGQPAAGDEDKPDAPRQITLYKPVGCDHCGGSGFRGRVGIHELMMVTRGLRHHIQTGSRVDDLQRHALADGMRTLRQDGIEKVLAGSTTIEEVRASS